MTIDKKRSFYDVEDAPPGAERFEELFRRDTVVIERITSSGTQPHKQYRQSQDEWVMLLRGTVTLLVDTETISLEAGDYVLLPANVTHDVLHTSKNALWLAVHVHPRERAIATPIKTI
jgi:cupin 2 domain-containing protein